jgi:hypothetical protein
MKTEDILKLQAGKPLDRFVAEKVFGCTVGTHGNDLYCRCQFGIHGDLEWGGLLHDFSTDIWYAWEVVEKLTENDPHKPDNTIGAWPVDFRLHRWNMNQEWQAAIQLNNAEWVKAESPSAPHAICLAALLATQQADGGRG